jgi:putative hydrolase of the HAD superfamily
MAISEEATCNIEAILFDMNGTLRVRELHEPTQRAAFECMSHILKISNPSDTFWEELAGRFKAYGRWAQENLVQLPEEEIWTRWLLPDIPPRQIEPFAAELTLAWSERKGRTVPKSGAGQTLLELKRRGYRLGIISNSLSSLDIPRCLDAFGWKDLFEVMVLSSDVKCRKPAPEIFWEATSKMDLEPAHCAYIGNRISRDVVGCKQAGFSLGLIIESPSGPRPDEQDQSTQPDFLIHDLSELLAIFPERGLSGVKVYLVDGNSSSV